MSQVLLPSAPSPALKGRGGSGGVVVLTASSGSGNVSTAVVGTSRRARSAAGVPDWWSGVGLGGAGGLVGFGRGIVAGIGRGSPKRTIALRLGEGFSADGGKDDGSAAPALEAAIAANAAIKKENASSGNGGDECVGSNKPREKEEAEGRWTHGTRRARNTGGEKKGSSYC